METERVKLREPNRLNVFVSHLWERDQIYWRLTGILRALLGSALVDHSIPTSAALKLMSCGPQALEEERGLQRAHLAICEERLRLELEHQTEESRELEAMRSWIADGSGAVAAQASLARQERRVADPIANGIGQRQLPSEIEYLQDLRRRAARAPTDDEYVRLCSAVSAKESELRATQRNIESLRDEVRSRLYRLSALEQHRDPSNYNEHEHQDVLMRAIRDPKSIARKHPNLALAIFERIRSSDVVFMLVGTTDMYREWMALESELVTDLGKVIVVVRPEDGIAPPPEMLRYSRRKSVRLEQSSIFDEINHLIADLPRLCDGTSLALCDRDPADPS